MKCWLKPASDGADRVQRLVQFGHIERFAQYGADAGFAGVDPPKQFMIIRSLKKWAGTDPSRCIRSLKANPLMPGMSRSVISN